ncbi:MAG: DUF4159 domain-containing protein [Planctomycetota bacterium]|nr:DUF4159 domain-containing protein [Planctomycetota bacterium]MDP7249537.1 DUF4159 domain-containing protein [Planctomycetota bacterium]
MPDRTNKTSFLSLLLCAPLGVLGCHLARKAVDLRFAIYEGFINENQEVGRLFALEGIPSLIWSVAVCAAVVAGILLISILPGILHRRRYSLAMLRFSCWACYFLYIFYFYAADRCVELIYANELAAWGIKPDKVMAFYWTCELVLPYSYLVLTVLLIHVNLWRRDVINLYTREHEDEPATGDQIVENVRSHGREPEYRKSLLGSVFSHFAVLILIPFLLRLVGCVEDYRVPKGSGNPVVALVKVVKPKKKKKKQYILNPDSPIYFHQPDIDDSELLKQVMEETELTYRADPNARAGKMGAGGGKTGGWPDGMENAEVRFIRMEYNGRYWDDGMDNLSRADVNFLEEFHRLTGFKVRRYGESHAIRLLKKYRKGYAPPFVYMTGNAHISVSERDVKIMRNYLIDGGMLFADCGGPSWNHSFHSFARRVFTDKKLLVISDDDPLFQMPYAFPNGAPPLWHHGGRRALGMKHKGRWVIFYHPGDINDAWKSGHSGLNPRMARGAFQMGINIVYYSFTNYLELTRKYRK